MSSSRKSTAKRTRIDKDANKDEIFAQVSTLDEYKMQDMPDADVYYMPDFISPKLAESWYKDLLQLDSWYQSKLKMYGREILQSRKIAAYSTDPELILKYSGQVVDMKYQYPPVLREIQVQVEERLGVKFNHVMLNLYENGTIYIGNHRDHIENKVIASVSLGAPRTFIMTRDKKVKALASQKPSDSVQDNKKRKAAEDLSEDGAEIGTVDQKTWTLASGSLVVMQGNTQRYWKHEIPKEPKVKAGRISLTFRQLLK